LAGPKGDFLAGLDAFVLPDRVPVFLKESLGINAPGPGPCLLASLFRSGEKKVDQVALSEVVDGPTDVATQLRQNGVDLNKHLVGIRRPRQTAKIVQQLQFRLAASFM